MRAIICGAGQVGYNIASFLSREENDVTVIDNDPELISHTNEVLDVNGIVGHASNPEVLSQAGATEADLIIAVTFSDEVNMVACQVAHSLFNVPKKIARVREQSYLEPSWANLFSRFHMPIDVIISPEIAVANAIERRLQVPGTTNVIPLSEDKVIMIGVKCESDCPVINTRLKQLSSLFPNLSLKVAAILREGDVFIPNDNDQLLVGDEAYLFIDKEHLRRTMSAFGHEEQEARNIIIMGGGNIGLYLTNMLLKKDRDLQLKIIEKSQDRARYLSAVLGDDVIVLHGDALDTALLDEAGIQNTETLVAVSNDDENNILGSLLAKQNGCQRVITLVNKVNYMPLINPLGIDATVSPRASTVSTIMHHVRRGKIKGVHNLREGIAEVIEAEASDSSYLVNIPLSEVKLPKNVVIGAVVKNDKVIIPDDNTVIKPGNTVILLATQGSAKEVEKLFTVHVDLFSN
jgi:trk system potassium uptake protein TrkA